MTDGVFSEQLAFLTVQGEEDEAEILARAMRTGVEMLYREALVEAYLAGKISRDKILKELGAEELEEIEYQRDALKQDVAWGMRGE